MLQRKIALLSFIHSSVLQFGVCAVWQNDFFMCGARNRLVYLDRVSHLQHLPEAAASELTHALELPHGLRMGECASVCATCCAAR